MDRLASSSRGDRVVFKGLSPAGEEFVVKAATSAVVASEEDSEAASASQPAVAVANNDEKVEVKDEVQVKDEVSSAVEQAINEAKILQELRRHCPQLSNLARVLPPFADRLLALIFGT